MKYLRFVAAASLPFALTACGRWYGGPGGGWGHMMPYGYGGMGIMWILFLTIIGVVLYAVIQGTRSSGKSDRSASRIKMSYAALPFGAEITLCHPMTLYGAVVNTRA